METEIVSASSQRVRQITRPPLGRFLATFAFAWLMIGLFTGTMVLVLLVRWLVSLIHHWGLGQTAENRALMLLILLFVAGSFVVTRAVVRRLFRIESTGWRNATLATLIVPGALSMWAWSNPTRVLAGLAGSERSSIGVAGGPQFIFGSYPDAQRLRELKDDGVTTIVSLQHPAVLVELQGIRDERAEAARLGLRFVQAPMLPWVSDNTESLETIREIARSRSGKFYIHCGLGRDRVNIAKRVVEAVADSSRARVVASTGLQRASGFEERADGPPFERGRLFGLAPDVWLIPFPNAAESHGFILQGRAGHVFLLLDPADTLQERWRRSAEQDYREYAIPYTVVPAASNDSARVMTAVARIRAAKPPVTIVVPATTWTDPSRQVGSRVAELVMKSFGVIPASARPVLTAPTGVREQTIEMSNAQRRAPIRVVPPIQRRQMEHRAAR